MTPGLFSTLGIAIKLGRGVSDNDTADRPWVAVVSESLVQRYWPHEQPIGRHFKFGFHDREIIGVVGDIRARGLERTSEPQVYLSSKQDLDDGFTYYAPKDLVIHSSQAPEHLLPAIRQIIHTADPEQPISNVRTMDEVVAGETESRTIQMRVLVVFAGVAIVLAGLGIYGLLAFTVSMRQQEFGIRLALGAGHGDIFRMVLPREPGWQWPACCLGWHWRISRPDSWRACLQACGRRMRSLSRPRQRFASSLPCSGLCSLHFVRFGLILPPSCAPSSRSCRS